MEFTEEDVSSHKRSIEPLVISSSLSSSTSLSPSDEVETAFSEDYVDSPRSVELKSPLDAVTGSGDFHSIDVKSFYVRFLFLSDQEV